MDQVEHLKLIQSVVERMARNSFSLKTWAVTLTAALYGLATGVEDTRLVLVSYLPIAMFWALDAYFLRQERLFRALYDACRVKNSADFSLDTTAVAGQVATTPQTMLSRTLWPFYGSLLSATIVASLLLD